MSISDEDGVIIEEDTFEYFETKVISVMKRIEFNQDLSMKETQGDLNIHFLLN